MNDESVFTTTIRKTVSEKGAEYIEIDITDRRAPITFTFRAYPKNAFVAIDDQSDDEEGGQDLDDCYLNPVVVVEKTPKELFDPRGAFQKCCARTYGDYDHCDLWNEVKFDVQKWMSKWTDRCLHLRVKKQTRLYAMETRYDPAEYEVRLTCQDCGAELDTIPSDAEVRDE